MTKSKHISQVRKEKTISSLENRITVMSEILISGTIPESFSFHRSDAKLVRWNDSSIGIYPVTINTARDGHPKLWAKIKKLRSELCTLEEASNEAKEARMQPSKKSQNIESNLRESKRQIQILTNELVMLRTAYLDLLSSIEQDEKKNEVAKLAIKRHSKSIGLRVASGHSNEE